MNPAFALNLNEPLNHASSFNLNEPADNFLFDLNQPANDGFFFDLNQPADGDTETEWQTNQRGTPAAAVQHKKRPKLSCDTRMQVLMWLLNNQTNGKLHRGSIQEAANNYNVTTRTISTIWSIAQRQKAAGQAYNMATKGHNAGRKRIQVQPNAITEINMGDRACIRDLAVQLKVSTSTANRMIKRGLIKPHTNPLHPALKDANLKQRVEWALNLLMGDTPAAKRQYYPMFNFVHIDEKWFYLSKKSQRVYLEKNEKGKYRAAKSSKFIPKVMFTAAVARPRFNANNECTFDGKLGIFPFTYQEPAKRASKNRAKGTIMTKVVESVGKKETRSMLINQIIPAIMEKWPISEGPKVIYIQQDNARTHINQDDAEWQQAHKQGDFTFILVQQPPNSPDLNILDLGFFRSIQSLMHKKMPKDVDDMMEAVHEAYFELDATTLGNVWLSYQYIMNEVLKVKGSNDYLVPHVNKKKLAAEGKLPFQVTAPMWAVHEAWNYLHGTG
ncbi:hypothetical protein DCAR_0205487 [Daucus carota subsp. sativus]|uniref:DUF7769 domain-containing protein n=1 Tax=Daucus carota subsp. sativus TaxID=79200 RepID=A0AAF0WBB0_DAUCS|nr:PREDICTED: uncharacterized protein LOC108207092 [Daucus carota subsp. sativus]WOG86286.1 hypothetical protein DCAR_0205487 [Daucus carota subsp. sativus]